MSNQKRNPDGYVGNGVEGVEIFISPAGNGWTFDGLTRSIDAHVAAAIGEPVEDSKDLEGGIYATREEALAAAVEAGKAWCIDRGLEFVWSFVLSQVILTQS